MRELVEHTLPWAAAALIPFIVFFESAALRNMVATYDAMAYARLFCIAVRRGVLLAFLDSACVDGVTTRVASMALPRDSRRWRHRAAARKVLRPPSRHRRDTSAAKTPSPRYATQVLGAWTSATGYMVIGRLSALTHQVLGQFKMACLLLGSYVVLGADLNRQQLGGASLTMASIVLYTRCTLAQRRRLEARRRGDEPLGRSPSEDPLLSPGRRRKVANGHSSSSRRMPGVLSSSRSSRAGVAVV